MYTHVSGFIVQRRVEGLNNLYKNHAEFVSVQTVDTLAHNCQVAIRKIDTGHSLVEILGIEAVGSTDALQSALALHDEVCSN